MTAVTAGALPVLVLGGSGYVAGEALRLLAGHPRFAVAGVLSESHAGEPVEAQFPHLAGCYPGLRFSSVDDLPRLVAGGGGGDGGSGGRSGDRATSGDRGTGGDGSYGREGACRGEGAPLAAALCAAPHGAAAGLVDRLLETAERAGATPRVVDLSADFRFRDAAAYARVYGHPHGAPSRLAQFRCALPEHAGLAAARLQGGFAGMVAHAGIAGGPAAGSPAGSAPGARAASDPVAAASPGAPAGAALGAAAPATAAEAAEGLGAVDGAGHVGHPGCFPTAVLLAAVPLVRLGWIEPEVHVVAVTGSTGAGRTPSATTHHPARRSNLFAYSPLAHRHEPEMRELAAAAVGAPVEIHFVPQAGPFARGIYATLQARLLRPAPPGGEAEAAAEIAADLSRFYAAAPFVEVAAAPPRLQDVVGSNRCRIGIAVAGGRLVAFSAIDNLTKGAAGGGIQWLNRMLGLPETCGLTQPGIGWL